MRASDIWGYTDSLGNEYALIGLLKGTSIVDSSDQSSPSEVAFVEGPESIWRDIKTWDSYAYISNETDSGVQIINLANLPASVDSKFYKQDDLKTSHNLWIDEQGFLYVIGSNLNGGGVVFVDLNADPWNPNSVGEYSVTYCHDVFVRGDTMYTAELYEGRFGIVNVADKSDPIVLATNPTPSAFTHNIWPSDDGKFVFTTDEVSGAYVAAYDISDFTDIKEVDRYRSSPGSGVIPHNTHFKNNFLITSYYRDGVTIVDATKPDNLIQTGYYDTSPFPAQGFFNGCWGAYPFLNSGLLLASDIEEGLFILQPTYKRAAYLEGSVVNDADGTLLNSTLIEILTTSDNTYTDFVGNFKTGTAEDGVYDIRISKPGCITNIYSGIELLSAETITLNASLTCTATATISVIPDLFQLHIFPTVSASTFSIDYSLPSDLNNAMLVIYNLQGIAVERISLMKNQDVFQHTFNAASGFYFARIIAGNYSSNNLPIVII
ncbi:MAG: choice-of-anchor B family protein [Bacteroidetes bacterium]|nr:choice-of-anchor B family protein [Bacteroidota bacterium]